MYLNKFLLTLIFSILGISSLFAQSERILYKVHLPKRVEAVDSIMWSNPNYAAYRDSVVNAIAQHPNYLRRILILKITETPRCSFINKIYVKSNLVALGGAVANAAVEFDLAEHWSFNFPVYYSAWDYFRQTVKFRTFAIQPEVRYWFSNENQGLFTGAHFGMAYYNLAVDGKYRYQDHNRKSPALGGGLSLGYRFPVSNDGHWNLEFSLGAGIYHAYYDKFENTPQTSNGLMTGSYKKTYVGLDQASVSICYMFDCSAKGGEL